MEGSPWPVFTVLSSCGGPSQLHPQGGFRESSGWLFISFLSSGARGLGLSPARPPSSCVALGHREWGGLNAVFAKYFTEDGENARSYSGGGLDSPVCFRRHVHL